MIQRNCPINKIIKVKNETFSVDLFLIKTTICGMAHIVVKVPANAPIAIPTELSIKNL